ncbi:DUF6779 domain-containing protein [Mycolicibacterium lacusdiani]|uniref:DUF6779 domain-containing protein n=1 Tax=Mycolicibacterium lacusdiani TaxID=2895283 RepID=UPI001F20BDE3|nr:DUF6779 domain-containing protein [Mycolicibacterium lacusdiani]
MADPTRGVRPRRASRRPGGALLTTLLVLAIIASSALVFTNSVELLKLAVIVALWAAVVAAFVSFIYRRQADVDSARARDLKLVYDLQLDREISARREYELGLESQLRRELSSELRAQSADEVASLRAELAALRANLEIIFDADLSHRPAIETERTTVHRFPDWDRVGDHPGERERVASPGRVVSSRIDAEDADEPEPNTEESPIIDVPVEPPPEPERPAPEFGGAHRLGSESGTPMGPPAATWPPPPTAAASPAFAAPPPPPPMRAPEPAGAPEPEVRVSWLPTSPPPQPPTPPPPPVAPTPAPDVPPPAARSPWQEPERPGRHTSASDAAGWRPAPAEGEFIPAGAPGSNWVSPVVEPTPDPTEPQAPEPAEPPTPEPTGPRAPEATEPPAAPPSEPAVPPVMAPPPTESRGRHSGSDAAADDGPRRARHWAPGVDPGKAPTPPTLASPTPDRAARHRPPEEPEDAEEPQGQHADGMPASELLARLQAGAGGSGRRRRRED